MLWRLTLCTLTLRLMLTGVLCARGQEASAESNESGVPSERAGQTSPVSPSTKAEETIEIPLRDIWAYNMPGTKDVESLDLRKLPQPLGTLCTGPLEVLQRLRKNQAGPGFAVVGSGQAAVMAAHRKLPAGEEPPSVFRSGSDISLVFYSHGYAHFVHLVKVERRGTTIEIQYELVMHASESFSSHFALIPLGKLPAGTYRVKISRAPLGPEWQQLPFNAERAGKIVCQPFSFTIEDN